MSRETGALLARVAAFYETLTPASLSCLRALYAPHATFKDPFNEVRGVEAIERIFRHMYEQVADPRFRVTERVAGEGGGVLVWAFDFRMKGREGARTITIRGVTHLRFDPDGRVTMHRDYWDAAEELYAKLPFVGALFRALRRRFAA